MRRPSLPLLFTFAGLLALLAVIAVALVMKKPVPVATDDDDDDDGTTTDVVAATATQGRHFDPTFGSLAALVPQGGSAPVLQSAAAMVGSAVPVEAHGKQFHDLAWLQQQGNDSYTLQVLAARSEDAVRQFIAGQKDPDQYGYFQSVEDGQPWFIVVYGSYGSRVQAEGTVPSLADLGFPTRPFAKAFSAYVSDITAPAAQPAAVIVSAPTPAAAPLPAPQP